MNRHSVRVWRTVMGEVWARDLVEREFGPGVHLSLVDLGGGVWAFTAQRWTGDVLHAPHIALATDTLDTSELTVALDVCIHGVLAVLAQARCSVSDALVAGESRRLAGRRHTAVDEVWNEFLATPAFDRHALEVRCPECAGTSWSWLQGVDAFRCDSCGYAIHGVEAALARRVPPSKES